MKMFPFRDKNSLEAIKSQGRVMDNLSPEFLHTGLGDIINHDKFDGDKIERDKNIYYLFNLQKKDHKYNKRIDNNQVLSNRIFSGRVKILKRLEDFINGNDEQNKDILVLSGLGGIGKSSIIKKFFCDNFNHFGYYGWLNFNDSIEKVFIDQIDHGIEIKNFSNQNIKEVYKKIVHDLKNLKGRTNKKNVLVIDGVDRKEQLDELIEKLPNRNWKIIITTRIKQKKIGVEKINLKDLKKGEAKKIFIQYYLDKEKIKEKELDGMYKKFDINKKEVENFLKNIGYHPLTIEISAKTLKAKGLESFNRIKEFSVKRKIKMEMGVGNKEITMSEYLNDLFSLAGINNRQLSILRNFALLDNSKGILKSFYFLIHGIRSDGEDSDKLENELEELINHGWLNSKKNQKSIYYFCHSIIQKFILQHKKEQPTLKNSKKIIQFFNKKLTYKYYLKKKDILINAESIIKKLEKVDKKNIYSKDISSLFNNIANIYEFLGRYLDAKKYFDMAILIEKRICKKDDEKTNLVLYLENKAIILEGLDEFEKAKKMQEEVIRLKKIIYKSNLNHFSLAYSYGNLALIFIKLGEFSKAKKIVAKVDKIKDVIYKKNQKNLKLAIIYSLLASIYKEFDDHTKVLDFLHKAVEIRERIYKKDKYQRDLASNYYNLSLIYYHLSEYKKANNLYNKVIEIEEKLYDGNLKHPQILGSKMMLASIISKLGDNKKAEKDYFRFFLKLSG